MRSPRDYKMSKELKNFFLSQIEEHELIIKKTKLSFSEEISDSILWLPSSTNLTNEDIKYVSNEVNNFFNN